MNKLFSAMSIAVIVVGCHHASESETQPSEPAGVAPKIVPVPKVADWVKHKSATVFDANGKETREAMGVVPGAILLSSSRDYPLSQLPAAKDSKLVFYCGGEMCRASDSAAARAAHAGYTDVNVMRAGISGWKTAGQPTEVPRS